MMSRSTSVVFALALALAPPILAVDTPQPVRMGCGLMTFDTVPGWGLGPDGKSVIGPTHGGVVVGKDGVSQWWERSVGLATITIDCEETFPSSSPDEIAHILQLRFIFDNGAASSVRGIFTYKVDAEGLLTNLRGYWNMDMMKPVTDGGD